MDNKNKPKLTLTLAAIVTFGKWDEQEERHIDRRTYGQTGRQKYEQAEEQLDDGRSRRTDGTLAERIARGSYGETDSA